MVDPLLPAIAGAANQLPAATRSRTVRNILKVLGLWLFPLETRRAIDDIADLESRETIRKALDKAAADQLVADPEIVGRYAARFASDAAIRQRNIEEIARMAIEETSAQGTHDYPDEESETPDIDDGWRMKFTSFAEGVSDDDMRRVWARLLAGEIKAPGSYSFQTMRLLAEMDRTIAEVFRDLSSTVIAGNAIYVSNVQQWQQGDLYLNTILLQNAGLIGERAGTSNRELRRDAIGQNFIYGNRYGAVMYSPSAPKKLYIPIIQLTESGKQLFRLLPDQDERFVIREICQSLSGQGMNPSGSFCFIGPRRDENDVTIIAAQEYLWGNAEDVIRLRAT